MSSWPGAGWLVWFSYARPAVPPTFVSPIGTQVDSPLQRQWTSLLSNGSIARIAADVRGASSSSSRAVNVNGPAVILSICIGPPQDRASIRRHGLVHLHPRAPHGAEAPP